MTRRWAPQTRYTLRRITAGIMKRFDLKTAEENNHNKAGIFRKMLILTYWYTEFKCSWFSPEILGERCKLSQRGTAPYKWVWKNGGMYIILENIIQQKNWCISITQIKPSTKAAFDEFFKTEKPNTDTKYKFRTVARAAVKRRLGYAGLLGLPTSFWGVG